MADCLRLKKSNCKNCYKCIRHCPVKSIRFSANQAHIVGNECILCGQCFVVCPQKAKEIVDETEKVKVLLQTEAPVIASIAPSFAANYPGVGIGAMREALMKLGFYDAQETGLGATIVKREYERMLKEDKRDILISSCCHSVNLLIQKHFPNELKYLANVLSPMQAHAKRIKEKMPGAKIVFIGPCVAKKDEAAYYEGLVDAVLTFEELTDWLNAAGVKPAAWRDAGEESRARFFPTAGGILKTMTQDAPGYTYLAIDGVENCMAALHDIQNGQLSHCFIEMSACTGSCIGGPVMEGHHRQPIRDYQAIATYAGIKDFTVEQPAHAQLQKGIEYIGRKAAMPSDAEVSRILKQMGKAKPENELNCGSCGYDTCREKAVAIYQGKADLTMCLPFLKERAENFSDTIVNATPNGLVVLNEELEVQQINRAALKMLNLRGAGDVLGGPVNRILETEPFAKVLTSGQNVLDRKAYLAEYGRYVEESILYDKEFHVLILILRDITEQETQREKKETFSRQTVEIADKVVEKQMRIVQEIASLLGETAAETKIALTKLKESIRDE